MNQIVPAEVAALLRAAKSLVVFTGAGVSAESGIPTFRDARIGLWERFDSRDLSTVDGFRKDKGLVWGWYEWLRMQVMQAVPNAAHQAIALLTTHVPSLTIITQNVDDLHERAGSTDVLHLHGSLFEPRCFACARPHPIESTVPNEPTEGRRLLPPRCIYCQGYIRPGVVWFQEVLPKDVYQKAVVAAQSCDVLLSIGTSGLVQPAAQIPGIAKKHGAKLVRVNPIASEPHDSVDWDLSGPAAVVVPMLVAAAFPELLKPA